MAQARGLPRWHSRQPAFSHVNEGIVTGLAVEYSAPGWFAGASGNLKKCIPILSFSFAQPR
jgi:hypothetical protein